MAANHALEHAEASELDREAHRHGQTYDCMAAILFCAFTLESYFNYLGKEKFPSWDKVERKLGPKEKLPLLLDAIKLSVLIPGSLIRALGAL